MRYSFLLCLPVLASMVLADPPAPGTQPVDPLSESRRIEDEISKLQQTNPVAKKIQELNLQRNQLNQQHELRLQPLVQELQKIMQSEAYKAYQEQLQTLQNQRQDKWFLERQAMAQTAKRLYAARHAELIPAIHNLPQGQALGLDVLTFPQLDGSTSTHPLSVIIASRLLNIPYEWVYPEPSGSPWTQQPSIPEYLIPASFQLDSTSGRGIEFSLAASRVLAKPPAENLPAQLRTAIMINSLLAANSSTHDAYVNLINHKCDLNLTARPPSASELKLAQEKGVTIKLQPIAKDALVFMVNTTNPIHNLTLQQIRDIYAGKITQWKAVAPDPKLIDQWKFEPANPQKNIQPLQREPDSGSRELFDALIPLPTEKPAESPAGSPTLNLPPGMSLPPGIPLPPGTPLPNGTAHPARFQPLYANSMSGPYNRITLEPLTLGYSVYYYEHFMALSPHTRNLAINGIEPTAATIAANQYPLTTEVYVAYRANEPATSPASKLLNWLLSPEGQSVIREAGYVPLK